VVYRPLFRNFIERQKELAAREHVELVSVEVGKEVSSAELRGALDQLLTAQRVDALWMLNDNGLVRSSEFLDQTWRPELQTTKVPLIVGVPNLIDPQNPLGTFALVPDHEALGLQAANMIFELNENDWRAGEQSVELPLSVKTVVDVKQARENFGLRAEALRHIDKEAK